MQAPIKTPSQSTGPGWHLERGDSVQLLRELPDDFCDAVITDPPYNSGGLLEGRRFWGIEGDAHYYDVARARLQALEVA